MGKWFLERFWHDDEGSVLAVQWVLVATVLVLGAVTGLAAFREAVLAEVASCRSSR
jgi:hypothetical protein